MFDTDDSERDNRPDSLFVKIGEHNYSESAEDAAANIAQLRASKLPVYAWSGGYPLVYYTTGGDSYCAKCAADPAWWTDYPAVDCDAYYEGPPIVCEGCNVAIESAYGDPGDPIWFGPHDNSEHDPENCPECIEHAVSEQPDAD